jgi:ubiquinone/menaquinone biosynthesis C-methylase UbiE
MKPDNNKNILLGLPIEYKKLPEYFDAHNISDDTDVKNSIIEKLLRKQKVNTVLDLTCGTGSQVFFLTKYGYKVIGSDFSPALLEIARKKALKEKLDIKFIDGDMRTLNIGQFDAVITIFNAIGHLTKADFEKAIRNIYKNLKFGGVYIFDIFNLQAMTDAVVHDLRMDLKKTINNTQIHNIQYSIIDRINGFLTSYDSLTIQKNAKILEKFKNEFTLQIYTAKELQNMLIKNGFEIVGQYGMDGSEFLEEKTLNILTVAKKKRNTENFDISRFIDS